MTLRRNIYRKGKKKIENENENVLLPYFMFTFIIIEIFIKLRCIFDRIVDS